MKTTPNRVLVSSLVAGSGIAASSAAMAHVDVGVNVGLPVAIVAPAPVYGQSAGTVVIASGRYGGRYYDGHRYWAHDEWVRNHHDHRARRGHRDNYRHDH